MERESINLSVLINGDSETLPEFTKHKNLVYCCENLVNGKVYVGETKRTLRERWLEHTYVAEERGSRDIKMAICNAIKKYGAENFSVYILEENLQDDDTRKEREKYWIEKLNSFVDVSGSCGYNMTTGGRKDSKIANEKGKRSVKTCIEKYGYLPILTKESRRKARETNRKRHGGILAFQAEKYREKGRETQIRKYGMLAMHLPENKEKAKKAQEKLKKQNGGVLPYNTKEAIEKAQKGSPLHRMIGCINRHIDILKKKGLEINAKNYVFETDDQKHMWQQHIPHVLRRIDELREIYKWNNDMDKIFSNIIYDETEKGIKKIKFKDENQSNATV